MAETIVEILETLKRIERSLKSDFITKSDFFISGRELALKVRNIPMDEIIKPEEHEQIP